MIARNCVGNQRNPEHQPWIGIGPLLPPDETGNKAHQREKRKTYTADNQRLSGLHQAITGNGNGNTRHTGRKRGRSRQ